MEVEVKQRFHFLPLVAVLLAQADDLAHHLDVIAIALGFGVDILDVVGNGFLLFLEALDALNEGTELSIFFLLMALVHCADAFINRGAFDWRWLSAACAVRSCLTWRASLAIGVAGASPAPKKT